MSDAAELEREAEAARARLSETADQLKARMSPGQLMDEVLTQFRDGDGNRMLENLRTQARDNPMALALVGSGLAWLMMGSGPSSGAPSAGFSSTPVRGSGAPVGPGSSGTAESAFTAARDAVGPTWDEASSAAGHAASSVRSAGSDALDSLRDGAGAAARAAHEARAAGEARLADLGHGAADLGHQARRGLADVLEREPLVIGALGLAVGAAIGALLPASTLEREHLGDTGEALRDKAEALINRGMSVAKEAAAEVYETARDEADRQGLVPGDRPIAEKVDAVVRAAGDAVSEIAERQVAATDAEGSDETARR